MMPDIGESSDTYIVIAVVCTDTQPVVGLRELQKEVRDKMYEGYMPHGGIGSTQSSHSYNSGGSTIRYEKQIIFYQAMARQND